MKIDASIERKAAAFKVFHQILEDEINNTEDENIRKYLIELKKQYPTSKEIVHDYFNNIAKDYISHNSNYL